MSTLSSVNVTDGNLLLKERTHTINNKIQLHILGLPPNKLGIWLIVSASCYGVIKASFICCYFFVSCRFPFLAVPLIDGVSHGVETNADEDSPLIAVNA